MKLGPLSWSSPARLPLGSSCLRHQSLGVFASPGSGKFDLSSEGCWLSTICAAFTVTGGQQGQILLLEQWLKVGAVFSVGTCRWFYPLSEAAAGCKKMVLQKGSSNISAATSPSLEFWLVGGMENPCSLFAVVKRKCLLQAGSVSPAPCLIW